MKRAAAWALLAAAATLPILAIVGLNVAWYRDDGIDLDRSDMPFWPGGLALMVDGILCFVALLFAGWCVASAIHWALEEVRGR